MRTFARPETGEHVAASNATAARLLDEGWSEIGATSDAEPSKKSQKSKQDPEPNGAGNDGSQGGEAGTGEIQSPEKPLDEMRLTDLVAYAETIGMPDVAELKKPGSSKAKAKDAIEAFLAAASQQ